MIYIDGLVLGADYRLEWLSDVSGTLQLSQYEIDGLYTLFDGVGIEWITGLIKTIPPRKFRLTVTDNLTTQIDVHDCVFSSPDGRVAIPDDEFVKAYFIGDYRTVHHFEEPEVCGSCILEDK